MSWHNLINNVLKQKWPQRLWKYDCYYVCHGIKLIRVNHWRHLWQQRHTDTGTECCIKYRSYIIRDDSRLAPSQWETSLQSNVVSHWLGANLESALQNASAVAAHVLPNNETWNYHGHMKLPKIARIHQVNTNKNNLCDAFPATGLTWCRHQMETFSASLALCAENSPVIGAM